MLDTECTSKILADETPFITGMTVFNSMYNSWLSWTSDGEQRRASISGRSHMIVRAAAKPKQVNRYMRLRAGSSGARSSSAREAARISAPAHSSTCSSAH
jgi:hypothetical protein